MPIPKIARSTIVPAPKSGGIMSCRVSADHTPVAISPTTKGRELRAKAKRIARRERSSRQGRRRADQPPAMARSAPRRAATKGFRFSGVAPGALGGVVGGVGGLGGFGGVGASMTVTYTSAVLTFPSSSVTTRVTA